MLAPTSLIVAVVVGFLVAYSPLAILGPNVFVGISCSAGLLIAFAGIALGAICWVEGVSSAEDAFRRSTAISLGITGTLLCGGAVLALVSLWLYLPTQMSFTLLGS